MNTIESILIHRYLVEQKILCHLYGQDLLSFHKCNIYDCTNVMKKELDNINLVGKSLQPYIIDLYEIYYKGRMKIEHAIIIALEYPNSIFAEYFLSCATLTGKIIKTAARLDKLDILKKYFVLDDHEYIGNNQIGALIGYGDNHHLIHARYYGSFIMGASRGGHIDITEIELLNPVDVLLHAFRGGSWNIIQQYNMSLFTYFHHRFLYRAAKGGYNFLVDFINIEHDKCKDTINYRSPENRKTIELDGYIVGGHKHLLPLNDKYHLGYLSLALKYGRIDIAKFIIDRLDIAYPLLLNYLQSHHLGSERDEWPEVEKYINELVENDRNAMLFLKYKYRLGIFEHLNVKTNWGLVEKEMELANGNITAAAMYAVKAQNIDRMAFYCYAGADKQILFSETQKLNNIIYTSKLSEAFLISRNLL